MNYNGRRIIGITGGIGSGKTMILNILEEKYNALVIEADKIGHKLQEPNQTVYNDIVKAFGAEILEEPHISGTSPIDRKKLGQIVFSDDDKLKCLNAITHPAIHKYIQKLIENSTKHLIVIEAAILTETSLVTLTDELWYIYADMQVRLSRLQQYRGISHEKALQVMANQPDDKHFREKCSIVIDNSMTIENTLQQIKEILKDDSDKI